MKAKVYDWIKTLVEVQGSIIKATIPAGTEGTVVEVYDNPEEYDVDVNVPDEKASSGYEFDNITLLPDQFVVLEEYKREEPSDEIVFSPFGGCVGHTHPPIFPWNTFSVGERATLFPLMDGDPEDAMLDQNKTTIASITRVVAFFDIAAYVV